MLMWEISSGQPPFINYENDYDLALMIVNGIRPKVVPGTPLEYVNLMELCWDADPSKRPDINTLIDKIYLILQYINSLPQLEVNSNLEIHNLETNYVSSTSKLFEFNYLPEPRNATSEEQEVFHSKTYDFKIPDNIDDFDRSYKQNSNNSSKIIKIFKDSSKKLSKLFKKLQINSNDDKNEAIQQQIKRQNIDIYDEMDEACNNPNLHSEEQDEFEIPDDGF
ncbi:hypothetical protein GLOIN_2v1853255 [Rhizophagus irregularis DAOM 181602=DAOM 197198]|uniref:Protein kinase domain-containing protein n=2 Tax=Rhizophagus irregularis TaxID=588596 RepID=A0A2P4QJ21_RHIID|nr:hypothetical protein GLOIN_2v1853255 [Rhizophagus irregularis DAOM 181602=DAOM 197198]POG77645.1 hypothetical protein GLOIN_2v1853255 [Rhizophagus irregularis DAOM 181602=DAOM 197198]|eukprot:XP_025184511.1 hypothetical protein GLOIN_2v1853255 [Rhizophagus irregularis DAOM 181602=DAOM 197198]